MYIFKSLGLIPKQKSHFIRFSTRYLGQAPTGRRLDNVDAAWDEAKKLFYRKSLTYNDFARRVDALRIFVFWGLIFGLTADLVLRPLESSYWTSWDPSNLPSRFKNAFGVKNVEDTGLPRLGNDNMTDASREYRRKCAF